LGERFFYGRYNTKTKQHWSWRQEWGLELPDRLSEEALLQLLADRIVTILEKGAEPLPAYVPPGYLGEKTEWHNG
jgi:hypothetical protein